MQPPSIERHLQFMSIHYYQHDNETILLTLPMLVPFVDGQMAKRMISVWFCWILQLEHSDPKARRANALAVVWCGLKNFVLLPLAGPFH